LDFEKEYISEFSPEQIVRFIKSYNNEIAKFGISIDEFCSILNSTHDLKDLSRRPFLLGIIIQTFPKIIYKLKKGQNSVVADLHINAASLYNEYTKLWLDREDQKGKTLISSKEKIFFCENLAFEMFSYNKNFISNKDLPDIIKQYFKNLSNISEIDYFSQDIQSCSFLTTDGKGNFSFIHKSFMEYFVARIIYSELDTLESKNASEQKAIIEGCLGKNYISTEICLFIKDKFSESKTFTSLTSNILEDYILDFTEIAFNNVLSILSKTNSNIGPLLNKLFETRNITLTDLSYTVIENVVLKNLSFDKVSFYSSKFSNVTFDNCSFNNCLFENAILSNVNFSKSTLNYSIWRRANINSCDFSFCSLIECDLSDAKIYMSNFNYADLSDNNVSDNTSFNNCIGMDTAYGAPYL